MTFAEAAEWMCDRFSLQGFLYQEEAASQLWHLHDPELAYFDKAGNLCVGKLVLKAFARLTPNAVYERAEKFWRERLPTDLAGRQQ